MRQIKWDDSTREAAIALARGGRSLEGIAHACDMSRATFQRYRDAEPDFDAALMRALSEYESDLMQAMNAQLFSDEPNPALIAQIRNTLVHRFPQRHSIDPRMRLDARAAREGYAEDLADPSMNAPSDQTGAVIGRLVERMLKEDEGEG